MASLEHMTDSDTGRKRSVYSDGTSIGEPRQDIDRPGRRVGPREPAQSRDHMEGMLYRAFNASGEPRTGAENLAVRCREVRNVGRRS